MSTTVTTRKRPRYGRWVIVTERIRTHGYGWYSRGCRCSTCTAAKRKYIAGRRADGYDLRPAREAAAR